MTPYYEQDGITLYHGDCREVLPTLDVGSVDLVLTDPPYGKGFHQSDISSVPSPRWHKPSPAKFKGVKIIGDKTPPTHIIGSLAEKLVNGSAFYCFSQWMVESLWIEAIKDSGLYLRNRLIWAKPHHGPGDLKTTFGPQHESILYASKGRHELRGKRDGDVWVEPFGENGCFVKGRQHPNEKPLSLISWLINKSSDADNTVLDPFCGSGTTLRAAKDAGLRAIGIEIEERYCEITARRLEQGVLCFDESKA